MNFRDWQARKAAEKAAKAAQAEKPIQHATPPEWQQPRTHIRQRPPVRVKPTRR
jgi:hypothetical protein